MITSDFDVQFRKLEQLGVTFERLLKHFNSSRICSISHADIFNALYLSLDHKMQFEWPGDLWDVDLDFEQAVLLLKDFDFNILHNTVETPDDWIPDNLLIKRKAKVKHQGQIWVIHKYDEDPFPSSPHAHNIDNGIKLDLSNGKCYRIRAYVHTITQKQLKQIRKKAEQVFSGELPVLRLV